ncbi:MAG TPA: hypothetical protein VF278_12655 [Pirellulales bacterium]
MEEPTILFLIGLTCTCVVLLFRTHCQLAGRPRSEAPPAASAPRSQPLSAARPPDAPLEALHGGLEPGELDSKIALFEQLVADARQQAERLETLLAAAARVGVSPRAGVKTPPAERAAAKVARPTFASAASAARRHAEIYSLADAGVSSTVIAGRLGSPIGEVELILGLRQS